MSIHLCMFTCWVVRHKGTSCYEFSKLNAYSTLQLPFLAVTHVAILRNRKIGGKTIRNVMVATFVNVCWKLKIWIGETLDWLEPSLTFKALTHARTLLATNFPRTGCERSKRIQTCCPIIVSCEGSFKANTSQTYTLPLKMLNAALRGRTTQIY